MSQRQFVQAWKVNVDTKDIDRWEGDRTRGKNHGMDVEEGLRENGLGRNMTFTSNGSGQINALKLRIRCLKSVSV